MVSIAISFLIMIISVSVSSGFREEIRDGISDLTGDVQLMRDMLRKVKGVTETDGGAAYGDFGIAVRRDLTGAQILKAVRDAFKGADSDDVSLFFIAETGRVDTFPPL